MTIEDKNFQVLQNPISIADGDTRPLSPGIGIEVLGVDLARPVSQSAFEDLRNIWHRHCVILFRSQRLSLIRQMWVANRFGSVAPATGGPPSVLEVSNARDADGRQGILPEGPIDYHSDQCYTEKPPAATMLYAVDVPAQGGNTRFANGFRAFETLPEETKRQLADRHALHLYDYESNPTRRPERPPPHAKQAVHPIFRLHRPTGRLVLYVNRLMTWSILGMEPQQSRSTLDHLFEHQERLEFAYEHAWQPGDLILWDNRSCIHGRTDFDPREARRLRRITLLDDR